MTPEHVPDVRHLLLAASGGGDGAGVEGEGEAAEAGDARGLERLDDGQDVGGEAVRIGDLDIASLRGGFRCVGRSSGK